MLPSAPLILPASVMIVLLHQQYHPARPEAGDCSYYLKTGTCKFGSSCKYNHPRPRKSNQVCKVKDKMKEREELTEKPGQTERKKNFSSGGCKHGNACSFNDKRGEPSVAPILENFLGLPIRPGTKECSYYMRNASCMFGTSCRFNHPNPTVAEESNPSSGYDNGGPASLKGASSSAAVPWSAPRSSNGAPPYVPPPFQGIPTNVKESDSSSGCENGGAALLKGASSSAVAPWSAPRSLNGAPPYVPPPFRGIPSQNTEYDPQFQEIPTVARESEPPSGYDNVEAASLKGASSSTAAPWSAPRSLNDAPPYVPPPFRGNPSQNAKFDPLFQGIPTDAGESDPISKYDNGGFQEIPTVAGESEPPSEYDKVGAASLKSASSSAAPPWSAPRSLSDAPPYVSPPFREIHSQNTEFDPPFQGFLQLQPPSGYDNVGAASLKSASSSAAAPWSAPRSLNDALRYVPPPFRGIPSQNTESDPPFQGIPTDAAKSDPLSGYDNGGAASLKGASPSSAAPWFAPRPLNDALRYVSPPFRMIPSQNTESDPQFQWIPTDAAKSDPSSGYDNGGDASLKGASSSTRAPWSTPRSLNDAPPYVPPSLRGIPSQNTESNPLFHGIPTIARESDPPSGYENSGAASLKGASSSASTPCSTPRSLNDAPPYVPPPFRGIHSQNTKWNGYQDPKYELERSVHAPQPYVMNNSAAETNVNEQYPPQKQVEELPELPGQPVSIYVSRTRRDCKFKSDCKYNHPKNESAVSPQSVTRASP